jgi:hypothetical protein
MNYTSYKLITLLNGDPTYMVTQVVADRIWCDLVSVLLGSGVDKGTNLTALHYLQQINALSIEYNPDTHIPVLKEAADWLSTL